MSFGLSPRKGKVYIIKINPDKGRDKWIVGLFVELGCAPAAAFFLPSMRQILG